MWKSLRKYIRRNKTKGFTIMLVPNSEGNVRSFCIPFFVVMLVFILIFFNVLFIICYPLQIIQINKKNAIIREKKRIIARQKRDLRQIEPSIRKTEKMIELMNKQKELEMNVRKYLQVVQNKVGYRGPVSRNSRLDLFVPPSKDRSLAKEEISLEMLNHNLDYIEEKSPLLQRELEKLINDLKEFSVKYDHIPTVWPVSGRITSGFGERVHPITRRVTFHTGVDIKVRTGTAVHAAANGVVEFAGYRSGYGWVVVINHGYGYKTLYAHNSRLVVHAGQAVHKGDLISFSGSSGSSTGPHLHYEIMVDNSRINPISFLRR